MATESLWRRWRRKPEPAGHDERPHLVDAGSIAPGAPWSHNGNGVREVRHYNVLAGRPEADEGASRDLLSGGLLWLAGLIIATSLAGAGYVAYENQRLFALAHLTGSDQGTRAQIIAALPDAGWASMAIVALVAALRGQSSARARIGVVVFFGLSLGAQVLYAKPTVEGYLVAVIAPVTLAWMLETFVVEVRRWAARRRGLDLEVTPILSGVLRVAVGVPVLAGRFALWAARMVLDRTGTWGGLRQWVLDEAPLAPGRTAASLRAAAAVEQAGSVQQAAELARAEARTEAEQAMAEAAAQVDQVRREAETAIEQAQREAAELAEQARRQAQAQMGDLETRTGQQVNVIRAEAAAQLEKVRAEAEAQAEATWRENAQLLEQRDQALAAVRRDHERLVQAYERLRGEHERLLAAAPAKAKLIALYERLGTGGDARWLDRERVAEVARELYTEAGLQSEGTARTYLYEYLDSTAARNGVLA
jgi:hypothetical protein